MPLKLVPSGACEGASFLALSDHEVTATPHAGTTFAIRSTGATKSRACHGATGYDVGTACKKAASQTPHQTQTVLHECTRGGRALAREKSHNRLSYPFYVLNRRFGLSETQNACFALKLTATL